MFNTDFNVIYLRVISGCNLNCTHCFTLGNHDKINYTSIEDIQTFLNNIKLNINPKKVVIQLHGGETFLRPLKDLRVINDIIKSTLDESDILIIPQTNLIYNITEDWINFIKEDCNNEIGISWDYEIRFGSIRSDKAIEKEELFFKNLSILLDNDINTHVAITQQRHLLKANPIDVVKQFNGVKSIDFELLTSFDEKTIDLKVNNKEWSDWFHEIVKYYSTHDTSWSLPQIDLFTKAILTGEIQNCKCNCCNKRTFTLNPNGTVGLCPDKAYISPLVHVNDLNDWDSFTNKAQDTLIQDLIDTASSICYTCSLFEYCAGNCNKDLFDNTDECPLSRQSLQYSLDNKDIFFKKYKTSTLNLPELRTSK